MGRWMVVLPAVALVACSRGDDSGKGPYAREVSSIVPKIERVTNLKFKSPPKVEMRTREQIRDFLLRTVDEETPKREIAGQQTAYRRLGAIPDTLDLRKLMVEALTEQIAGFYDPRTKVLYIPTDAKPELVSLVLSHELVHALQDQYFAIDSLENVRGQGDEVTAARAVLEGQAQLVALDLAGQRMVTWEQQRERIREAQSAMPVFAAAPLIIQETLLFPYLSGADFMGRFYDKFPGQNPFTAKALPRSTEQIMHGSAYFGTRDAPTAVTLPAPVGATASYDNNLGEFEIRVVLFQHLRDAGLATRAAAGWDGDRYVVLDTPKGDGLAWVTVWDSAVDAAEFSDAMGLVVAKRYPSARARAPEGSTKRYFTPEREIVLWGGEIQGRPAVMYVDVPTGTPTNVIDPEKVTLKE